MAGETKPSPFPRKRFWPGRAGSFACLRPFPCILQIWKLSRPSVSSSRAVGSKQALQKLWRPNSPNTSLPCNGKFSCELNGLLQLVDMRMLSCNHGLVSAGRFSQSASPQMPPSPIWRELPKNSHPAPARHILKIEILADVDHVHNYTMTCDLSSIIRR